MEDTATPPVLKEFLTLLVKAASDFVGVEQVGKMVGVEAHEGFFSHGTEAVAGALTVLDAQTLTARLAHILDVLSTNFGADLIENHLEEIYARIERQFSPELANQFVMPLIPATRLEKYRIQFLSKEQLEKRVLEKTVELQKLNADLEKKVAERTEELRKLLEEQRRKDVELTKANEELRVLDKAKDDFVALVSHELRTPLTGIRWLAEALEKSSDTGGVQNLTPQQNDMVKNIRDGIGTMVDLINTILDTSRIESGTLTSTPVDTDLADATKSIIAGLAATVAQKGIRLEEHYMPEPLRIPVDPTIWRSLVQNLLSNAVKYTPAGGTVSVEIVREATRVSLTVRDTGLGIPADQQAHIFSKLFRATNARSIDPDGLGLGLYITKAAVTQTGGDLYFESAEGKGAAFHIIYPTTGMLPSEGAARI